MNRCTTCVQCALKELRSSLLKLQVRFEKISTIGQSLQKFHVQEQYEQGEEPRTPVAGIWNTRALNTVITNDIGEGASISNETITLTAGFYDVVARAPGGSAGIQRLRLTELTSGDVLIMGMSSYAGTLTIDAVLCGRLELEKDTSMILSQYYEYGGSHAGTATDVGGNEIYSEIIFYKVK